MLGRFKIEASIGSGGMGTVYRATDPELGRTVAIKVLNDDDGDAVARARLVREAQAMARLAHPNVVPVHEIGSGAPCFIVMELVVGETVRQWLAQPRSTTEILDVFRQAGEGLAAAHAASLVHRDFKPENILRGRDGRVRVVDFGLVASRSEHAVVVPENAALDVGLTQTGLALGTPAYMAPEQHAGEAVDARGDQFSFAVALHEALYGQRPFAGATYREMVRNLKAGNVLPPKQGTAVPFAIRTVLLRALSVAPAARFPSIAALLAELAPAPNAVGATPAIATPPPLVIQTPRRRGLQVLVGAVAVAAIIAGTVIATSSSQAQREDDRGAIAPTAPPTTPSPTTAPTSLPPPPVAIEGTTTPERKPPVPIVKPPPRMIPKTPAEVGSAVSPRGSASPPAGSGSAIDDAAERRRRQLELKE